MRRARDLADFMAAPLGSYLVGKNFLCWIASPSFNGSVHWGRRTQEDARAIIAIYELRTHPGLAPPFDRVVDGRALESVDADAFEIVDSNVKPRLDELRRFVRRQAVIVTPDFSGTTQAGLLAPLGVTAEHRVFHDPVDAYAWADPRRGPSVRAEVEALVAAARSVPPLLDELRRYLRREIRHASAPRAARFLKMSERSLQRRLRELGSSFRDELLAARVQAAKSLLAATDAKIEEVARRVGCGSASQLGAVFRRAGEAPPARLRKTLAEDR